MRDAEVIKWLYIEDKKNYFEKGISYLEKYGVSYIHIISLEEFVAIKEKVFDIVLTDLNFPLLKKYPKFKDNYGNFIGLYYKFIEQNKAKIVRCYSSDFNSINKTFFHFVFNKELHSLEFIIDTLINYYKKKVFSNLNFSVNSFDLYYRKFLGEIDV